MRPRTLAIVPLLLALAAAVSAADQPVSGKSLQLKRSNSSKEQLKFASKDPALLFPAIGGADDPTLAGLTIELFNPSHPTVVFNLAATTTGWTVKPGTSPSYKYKNKDGAALVKSIAIRAGKQLQLELRQVGFPLAGPMGPVGIRVSTGALRNCALFDGSTIKKDQIQQYKAVNALASTIPDCEDASLGAFDPGVCENGTFGGNMCGGTCPAGSLCSTQDLSTCVCIDSADPCGDTAPVCNGQCPVGEECLPIGGYPLPSCGCLPAGSTPCSGMAICSGDCPAGSECNFFVFPLFDSCQCGASGPCGSGGDDCPPGQTCHVSSGGSFCL
jgi:hypothetical protein